ncbi:M56 family metallopeptidase [Flagellimonas sp. HMM57]|uniref:M56 family metallopeptidase n=1 Tax=unclassified Flagellimonas TaxID=2644544 RepID=UPI0013D6A171|nr:MULTISPECIES: M56 family metallopeptidase [unclassified Flagellimonas]UII77121.1 M56 family metallopeptidase [Flagellimonas sp. HMM57]
MIQYFLECLVFQLVFLLIYDLFLKWETFFQWNRVYLIGTYLLSLVLPWITIEAFKTTVPEEFSNYTQFVFQLNEIQVGTTDTEAAFLSPAEWGYLIFFIGVLFMTFWFGFKLFRLYRLRQTGAVSYHTNYTKVVVAESALAFSFFKYIFLGAKVSKENTPSIIAHELVHIEQKHSLDLLFFELMHIISWFNPLVYLYQKRIAELHEFIADSEVSKHNKKEQYQILLSEVFQTQNISFVNQFFKKSLIKKRIVMLQKSKSKRIYQLKYLFLLPIIMGMLLYTSCENGTGEKNSIESSIEKKGNETFLVVEDLNAMTEDEKNRQDEVVDELMKTNVAQTLIAEDGSNSVKIYIDEGKIQKMEVEKDDATMRASQTSKSSVPFGEIDEVPIFRGCEGATDTRLCFMEKIQTHIKKYFYYPEEAQNKGIEGRVNVIFTITEEGFVEDIRTRGPDKILEDVVTDIISKLPRMQPGKSNGQHVSVPFSIPVTFKLQ